jgi:hypothetical protein
MIASMKVKPARLFDHGNTGTVFEPSAAAPPGFDPMRSAGNGVRESDAVPATFSTTMSAGVCVPIVVEPRRYRAS